MSQHLNSVSLGHLPCRHLAAGHGVGLLEARPPPRAEEKDKWRRRTADMYPPAATPTLPRPDRGRRRARGDESSGPTSARRRKQRRRSRSHRRKQQRRRATDAVPNACGPLFPHRSSFLPLCLPLSWVDLSRSAFRVCFQIVRCRGGPSTVDTYEQAVSGIPARRSGQVTDGGKGAGR